MEIYGDRGLETRVAFTSDFNFAETCLVTCLGNVQTSKTKLRRTLVLTTCRLQRCRETWESLLVAFAWALISLSKEETYGNPILLASELASYETRWRKISFVRWWCALNERSRINWRLKWVSCVSTVLILRFKHCERLSICEHPISRNNFIRMIYHGYWQYTKIMYQTQRNYASRSCQKLEEGTDESLLIWPRRIRLKGSSKLLGTVPHLSSLKHLDSQSYKFA